MLPASTAPMKKGAFSIKLACAAFDLSKHPSTSLGTVFLYAAMVSVPRGFALLNFPLFAFFNFNTYAVYQSSHSILV